jgi:hypothetical protein
MLLGAADALDLARTKPTAFTTTIGPSVDPII